MADMTGDRAAVTRFVYERLADPVFRQRLTASDASGSHPIVVALRSDAMGAMIADVAAMGGQANVAVPTLNGIVVFSMVRDQAASGVRRRGSAQRIRSDCTVGVFLERLGFDGGEAVYQFVVEGPERQREAVSAQALALAG